MFWFVLQPFNLSSIHSLSAGTGGGGYWYKIWIHYSTSIWIILCFINMMHNMVQMVILSFNSLAPRRFKKIFKKNNFKLILVTDGCDISSEIALKWPSLDLSDDKSTLVQIMAWCHKATSHYLNQCWPRSLPPYGVTRPQWVKAVYIV